MARLDQVLRQADELSPEDRNGLLAHLLNGLQDLPLPADEEEIDRHDSEMDSGSVEPIDHDEFIRRVGR